MEYQRAANGMAIGYARASPTPANARMTLRYYSCFPLAITFENAGLYLSWCNNW